MAAKPTPIIPTAIANPRDPYVATPLDVPVAVLVLVAPVPEAVPAFAPVPVGLLVADDPV